MPGGRDVSTDQTQNLAGLLADKEPSADLRIGIITAIGTTPARKVQTDQTDAAWLARDQDTQLLVGDRVWMVRQKSTFIVAGRLSGSPSGTICKRKLSAQVVTSSTTLVNDTDLAWPLLAGTYRIELFVHASSPSDVPDLRSAWTFVGGTIGSNGRSVFGPGVNTTAAEGQSAGSVSRASGHGFATAVQIGLDAGLSASVLHEDMLVTVTVPGTLQWQWAQGASNANATTVSTASRMYVTPTQVF
jgi:hypothetical protein